MHSPTLMAVAAKKQNANPARFLPMTRAEMDARGWDELGLALLRARLVGVAEGDDLDFGNSQPGPQMKFSDHPAADKSETDGHLASTPRDERGKNPVRGRLRDDCTEPAQ